jgi:hypothetical protein
MGAQLVASRVVLISTELVRMSVEKWESDLSRSDQAVTWDEVRSAYLSDTSPECHQFRNLYGLHFWTTRGSPTNQYSFRKVTCRPC